MTIAVDAMGGDHAPGQIVRGAVAGLEFLSPDGKVVLVGQADQIQAELAQFEGWAGRVEVVGANQVIGMGEQPVEALRSKPDSSITRMVELAADGSVDAMISAGNTGACVAACQMKLRSLKGVSRPGIPVIIPSFGGPVALCDVGANVAPKPHHMHQYALMCSIYVQDMFKLTSPARVAMLSIGEEDGKGNKLVHEARDLIKSDPRINFVGYLEGRTMLDGVADVIICDGFVGNVVLKLVEGLAAGLVKSLAQKILEEDPKLAQASKSILENIMARHDYNAYGGAPLLGVDGICIICHGASNWLAIKNSVAIACSLSRSKLNQRIVQFLAKQH